MNEGALALDGATVSVRHDDHEGDVLHWKALWVCEKWSEEACDFVRAKLGLDQMGVSSEQLRALVGEAEEIEERPGNLLLQEGINEIWNLCTGVAAGSAYSNANARIGVGDSTTAEAANQTGLVAATNKLFKAMNASYPQLSGTGNVTCSWQSDFLTAEANYAWQEWSIDNGTTRDKNLNRKVASLGTKASGTWTLTAQITLS